MRRLATTPENIAAVREYAALKMTPRQIARALDVSHTSVRAMASQNGINMREHALSPVPIPAWVPKCQREDYRSEARLYGEEIAARNARRAKAEAAQ